MKNKKGRPFIAIAIAIAALAGLSFVPWSTLTGGIVKDFNLLGDIMPDAPSAEVTATEPIDPDLVHALAQLDVDSAKPEPVDTVDNYVVPEVKPARVDGQVLIEDYTADGRGLYGLHKALSNKGRTARIAFIGDSYIEGDILTQNVRESLQNKYGGSGVGYMGLQSALTGFRTSVHQQCAGWTLTDIRKTKNTTYKWLSGEYFTAGENAKTVYKGSKKLSHLASWTNTRIVYIAPEDGTITINTDGGEQTFQATASPHVCSHVIYGNTTQATICASPGIVVLGAFLDGDGGIAVDNMSMRGNSGISHRNLSVELAGEMRQYVDYDLIVIEFGINALSSQQSNYSSYGKILQQVIQRIRACYPAADILLMGIGDRGQKIDGEVTSLPTSKAMVDAQRNAARKSEILFWDTREAMGGSGAVIDWRNRGLVNADYIHLNSKGGKELADLFVSALLSSINK